MPLSSNSGKGGGGKPPGEASIVDRLRVFGRSWLAPKSDGKTADKPAPPKRLNFGTSSLKPRGMSAGEKADAGVIKDKEQPLGKIAQERADKLRGEKDAKAGGGKKPNAATMNAQQRLAHADQKKKEQDARVQKGLTAERQRSQSVEQRQAEDRKRQDARRQDQTRRDEAKRQQDRVETQRKGEREVRKQQAKQDQERRRQMQLQQRASQDAQRQQMARQKQAQKMADQKRQDQRKLDRLKLDQKKLDDQRRLDEKRRQEQYQRDKRAWSRGEGSCE